MYNAKLSDSTLSIKAVDNGIFRVRMAAGLRPHPSLMEKYGIISEPVNGDTGAVSEENNLITIKTRDYSLKFDADRLTIVLYGGKKEVVFTLPSFSLGEEGFALKIGLDESEKLYGLGDENRDSINKRGRKATIWQANVVSYGPIPFLMSSNAWGIFVNSTYRQEYDLGMSNNNLVQIDAEKGELDFYLFTDFSMLGIIEKYTRITGRPTMLPKSAFGFTYVANEETNARELLEDCLRFRDRDIPCDIIGLEPDWMDEHYDYSTDKKWSPERFWLPYWSGDSCTASNTFFYNLRKMGFHLSLWLCCDYDLLWEEEKEAFSTGRNSYDGAEEIDEHFAANVRMDKITKAGEAWFEHLKKFVDNGASAFKLDGANQVLEHPDRLWAGKYSDDEVHNVYPVIYAKQMKEGFEKHTGGRRAMIYTAALYAGTQKYAATWAGDTGGGPKSLVSILNLAMCGHSNASCDMSQNSPEGIHFGFLAPWAQLNSWRYWFQPWFLGEELEDTIRRYSKLRSALFPYTYSMAHKASEKAIPMARPMCLMYPEEEALAECVNMYMLGDSLLVGAYDMNMQLPMGRWLDLFTGEFFDGGKPFTYEIPKGYGGALFAKPGALWVTQEPKAYIHLENTTAYTIHATYGGNNEFDFIEDDGVTNKYQDGEIAKTHMTLQSNENTITFTLYKREGGYEINENDVYNIDSMSENHICNVKPLPAVTDFTLKIYSEIKPKNITINGREINADYRNNHITAELSKEEHEQTDIIVVVNF